MYGHTFAGGMQTYVHTLWTVKEWLESPSLQYMPRLRSDEKGYSADLENGVECERMAL